MRKLVSQKTRVNFVIRKHGVRAVRRYYFPLSKNANFFLHRDTRNAYPSALFRNHILGTAIPRRAFTQREFAYFDVKYVELWNLRSRLRRLRRIHPPISPLAFIRYHSAVRWKEEKIGRSDLVSYRDYVRNFEANSVTKFVMQFGWKLLICSSNNGRA